MLFILLLLLPCFNAQVSNGTSLALRMLAAACDNYAWIADGDFDNACTSDVFNDAFRERNYWIYCGFGTDPVQIYQVPMLTATPTDGSGVCTFLPTEVGLLVGLQDLLLTAPLTVLPTQIGLLTTLTKLTLELGFSTLPTEIGQLTALQELILLGPLTSLPTQIGLLTSLTNLQVTFSKAQTLPTQIGTLSSLQSLTVDQSTTLTSIPTQIGMITTLTDITFFQNQAMTAVPSTIGNLVNLQSMGFRYTGLAELPTSIGTLTSLTTLAIGLTKMTSLPTQIGLLQSLEFLSITQNAISSLPSTIQNLTMLRSLDLLGCRFQIFPTVLTGLGLETLDISNQNLVSGQSLTIPTQIGEMTSLRYLYARGNLVRSIPTQMGLLSVLGELDLSSNLLTSVPLEQASFPRLYDVTLRSNRLKEVPPFLYNLTNLVNLDLSYNRITNAPNQPLALDTLTIDHNQIQEIPPDFWSMVVGGTFRFGFNNISALPTEIGLIARPREFSFEGNRLQSIPTEIFTQSRSRLNSLKLGYNNISFIPTEIGTATRLTLLDLSSNNVQTLPTELSLLPRISKLYLSGNKLREFNVSQASGFGGLGGSGTPQDYQLADNLLEDFGTLGTYARLQVLKISGNKITWVPILNTSSLRFLDISNNQLTDPEGVFKNLSLSSGEFLGTLEELYLSNNKLTGCVPKAVESLTALTFLDMSYNLLTSAVVSKLQIGDEEHPTAIQCSVPSGPALVELDLSHNQIELQVQPDPITGLNRLYADNFTYPCDFSDYGVIDAPYFTIFVASPLTKLDLSYNYISSSVDFAFGFNPLTPQEPYNYVLPQGQLNLGGNRMPIVLGDSFLCTTNVALYRVPISPCIVLPQDLNECELGTHLCPPNSNCSDGWNPQMSYTCTCDKGYRADLSQPLPDRPCNQIDECQEIPPPCPSGFKCIDYPGSFECERDYTPLIIVLPVVLGVILLAIFVFFLISWLLRVNEAQYLHDLPDEVKWTWKQAIVNPNSGWEPNGGFLSKEFIAGTSDYERVDRLISTLDLSSYKINRVVGVYNKVLVSGFVTTHKIQSQRYQDSSSIFFSTQWSLDPVSGKARERVFQKFRATAEAYQWNKHAVVILPVVHGTDLAIAERIAKTGFAALSQVDAGYYGKGIYFTSRAIYSLPYVVVRRQPALIVSWVLTGNPYPVIEDHDADNNMMGGALKSGHQSHYVVVGRQGRIATEGEWGRNEVYDEVVLDQETQIAPVYILELDNSNFSAIQSDWDQTKAEAGRGDDRGNSREPSKPRAVNRTVD